MRGKKNYILEKNDKKTVKHFVCVMFYLIFTKKWKEINRLFDNIVKERKNHGLLSLQHKQSIFVIAACYDQENEIIMTNINLYDILEAL